MNSYKCGKESLCILVCRALIDFTDNQFDAEQLEYACTLTIGNMIFMKGLDVATLTEAEFFEAVQKMSEEPVIMDDMTEYYQEFGASSFNGFMEAVGQGMECLRNHFKEEFNINSDAPFRVEIEGDLTIEFNTTGYAFL